MSTTGIMAKPRAPCQPTPSIWARRGATRTAITVPLLPAPAIPMARPWCSGGYHRLASGSATAKLAPAMPSSTPSTSSWVTLLAAIQPQASGISTNVKLQTPTRFGPNRSTRRPSRTRKTAPPSSGTATTSPFCAAVSPRSCAINTPRAPIKTHTMKLTSKWRKAAKSDPGWPLRIDAINFFMTRVPYNLGCPVRTV